MKLGKVKRLWDVISYCLIFLLLVPSDISWARQGSIYGLGLSGDYLISFGAISVEDARLFIEAAAIEEKRLWVNLSPASKEDTILPFYLWAGRIGQIFLKADLDLKRDVMKLLESYGYDWQEETDKSFRVFIRVEKAVIGRYINADVLEGLSLKVVFDGNDKKFIDFLNCSIARIISKKINTSQEYLLLRKAIAMYFLSRLYEESYWMRLYISQPWVDRNSGISAYRSLFYSAALVGGVEVSASSLKEEEYDSSINLPGRCKIKITDAAVLDNLPYIRKSESLLSNYDAQKPHHPFLPELRILKDLGKASSATGEILLHPEEVDVEVKGQLRALWRKVRETALGSRLKELKSMSLKAAQIIGGNKPIVFSVEAGLDENLNPQIFQVRPVHLADEELPTLEELRDAFYEFLKGVSSELSERCKRIVQDPRSSLFEKMDSFLDKLDNFYGKDEEIFMERLVQNEKALLCILLFDTLGHHYLISSILGRCIAELGVDWTVRLVKKVLSIYVASYGANAYEEMEKVSGFRYSKIMLILPERRPLFGLAGGLVILGREKEGLLFLKKLVANLPEEELDMLKTRIRDFVSPSRGGDKYLEEEGLGEFLKGLFRKEEMVVSTFASTQQSQANKELSFLGEALKVNEVVGRLRLITQVDDLGKVKDGDIVVVEGDLPSEYPLLVNIPSAIVVIGDRDRLSCPQSHIRTYMRQREIPVFVGGRGILELMGQWNRSYVKISVDEEGNPYLSKASEEEFKDYIEVKILPKRREIEAQIEAIKARMALGRSLKVVNLDSELINSGDFGVKAVNLGKLIQAGIKVPEGVTVSTALLKQVLSRIVDFDWDKWREEVNASFEQGFVSGELKRLAEMLVRNIRKLDLSDIAKLIWNSLPNSVKKFPIIIRSSSQFEDMEELPFVGTGVLKSVVVTEPDVNKLEAAIKDVLCSVFSFNSLAEKVSLGINPVEIGLGLIIQEFSLSQVGMVGEVIGDDVKASFVLGSNTLITSGGKEMGSFDNFLTVGKLTGRFYEDRVLRYQSILQEKDLAIKLFKFWREALICLGNWSNEAERLYWVELWDIVGKDTDEVFKEKIRELISGWIDSLKEDFKEMSLSDKVLLYWLPLYVLGQEKGKLSDKMKISEADVSSALISGLQVILVNCPWAIKLEQIKEWLDSDNSLFQRLGANLLFYAIDVIGVLHNKRAGNSGTLEKVGGILVGENF